VIRDVRFDVSAVVAAKLVVGSIVLAAGFSHISDDDYARVVIAEHFAHAPHLDPSGTSWLPFPFWSAGAAMMVFGRSIATARAVSIVLSAAATASAYAAMRAAAYRRAVAVATVAGLLCVPLDGWVGVATVPESYTGALVAAALFAATANGGHWRTAAAFALFVASLSRYETWPACAVVAIYAAWCALQTRHDDRAISRLHSAFVAAVASAGPLTWMTWNAIVHGSSTYFVDRVARYRVAIGEAPEALAARLVGFPRALVTTAPWLVALSAIGLGALLCLRASALRSLALPLAGAAATLAFLVYGDVKNGAPTHHPERALLGIFWVLSATAFVGIDALCKHILTSFGRHSARRRAAFAAAWLFALLRVAMSIRALCNVPGRDPMSDRSLQIARGAQLREANPASLEIAPCMYEHFALLAEFAAPERAHIVEAKTVVPDGECPHVVVTE
jgi:hypothetical protein